MVTVTWFVTCHVCLKVSIDVDDSYHETGTTVGKFSMLSSKWLHLAGNAGSMTQNGTVSIDNFRGCMKKVSIVFTMDPSYL